MKCDIFNSELWYNPLNQHVSEKSVIVLNSLLLHKRTTIHDYWRQPSHVRPQISRASCLQQFFFFFFWAVHAILYFSRPDLSRKNAVEMSCRMAFQCWLKFFFCKYYLVPLSAKWIIFICIINLLRSSNLLNLFLEIKKLSYFQA